MKITQRLDNPKKPMLIEMPLQILPYDIDFSQTVSSFAFQRWFDEIRMAFHDCYWPINLLMQKGLKPHTLRATFEYQKPLSFNTAPIGKLWVSNMDKYSWTFQMEIIDKEETVYCKSMQSGIFASIETHMPEKLPMRLIEKYERSSGKKIAI